MSTNGYWDTMMEGFVRYFQRYADWLPGVIEGASPSRIERVEALVGQAFPPEYRAFLSCMGDTPRGALDPFLEDFAFVFGIDAIEEMYSQAGFCAPHNAVFLWTYQYDSPYDIFLETQGGERDIRGLLQAGWAIDEDTGALLPEPPHLMPCGGSLMQALYKHAYLKLRDPLLSHAAQLRDRAGAEATDEAQRRLREAFVAAAEHLGFSAVPYMDGDLVFFDRPDASLKLYAQPLANVVYVHATDEREIGRLRKVLADSLAMAIWL